MMRHLLFSLIALLGAALFAPLALAQEGIETPASHAFAIDFDTGAVLFSKNADRQMPPASMSKLMTVEIVLHKLKLGELKLDDTFRVSEKAWRMGGSKMFVDINSEVRVADLLRGIIVQSGNDACIVVAEGLAGTEEAFAQMMNERAKELGMNGSHFTNATGWPDPGHLMTPRDLAILAAHIIREYPDYYTIYAEKEFTWHGITQGNRNPLLYGFEGGDGLKTGHTSISGFGLVGSAKREGRRIILVVNGLADMQERADEGKRLLDLAFREFKPYALFKPGDVVGEAEVWSGGSPTVRLTVAQPVTLMLSHQGRNGLKITYAYDGPVRAPIAAGQPLGTMTIIIPTQDPITLPLYAAESVDQSNIVVRMVDTLVALISGS